MNLPNRVRNRLGELDGQIVGVRGVGVVRVQKRPKGGRGDRVGGAPVDGSHRGGAGTGRQGQFTDQITATAQSEQYLTTVGVTAENGDPPVAHREDESAVVPLP